MRGNQIRDQVLLHPQFFIHAAVLLRKGLINAVGRLSHQPQHPLGNMFRRHLQLTAHMILAQLPQELVGGIGQHVVKTDP